MSQSPHLGTTIFFNRENELRSGWRVAVFIIVLFTILTFLSAIYLAIAPIIPGLREVIEPNVQDRPPIQTTLAFFIERILLFAALIAASWFCARFLEKRTLASIGFQFHPGWKRDFLLGLLAGGIAVAFAIGIGALAGSTRFERPAIGLGTIIIYFVALSVTFLVAAAAEEVWFRGFPFQALLHNVGPVVPIAVTSLLFALVHISNPNATLFSTINTMLAGVWLGVAYLMTRSLWLATGLHFAWNFVMVFVFGLPVSGIDQFAEMRLLRGESGGPAWLTGGVYGPEGGAAATAALVLCTLFIWKSGLFRTTREMLEAARHNSLPGEIEDAPRVTGE